MEPRDAARGGRAATARVVVIRRQGALAALAVAIAVGATISAGLEVPPQWLGGEVTPADVPTDPLREVWIALATAMPGIERTSWAALALSFAMATGAATGWLGYQLFRGPGRGLAAAVAALLSTAAVGGWARSTTVAEQFPALPFTVLALVGVTALVRPLVHLGRLTPVACARSLAAAGAAAVVLPRAGLPLLALCAATCLFRGRRIEDLRGPRPDASLSRATMSGSVGGIVGVGVLWPLLAGAALWATHDDGASAWAWVGETRLIAPPFAKLRAHLDPYLIYPGLALVTLLVAPLRWRGGVTLLGMLATSLVVGTAGDPLAPMPVLMAGITLSASGWIWLGGTAVRSPTIGRPLALIPAAGLLWLGLVQPRASVPIAERRPTSGVAFVVADSLDRPGDVVLLHDPVLQRELLARQRLDGARPDLSIVDARRGSAADLEAARAEWSAGERRVLSDSFDLAGRWSVGDATEAEALFSFAFDPRPPTEHEPIAVVFDATQPDERQLRGWTQLYLEHTRFRRAIGRDADAALALPLSAERDSLRTAIRVSRSVNLPAEPGSELGAVDDIQTAPPHALALAEAGDLLYGAGERALGLAMLGEAAALEHGPAWRALARWHLRAGELEVAEEVLESMTRDPGLRDETLEVIWWLVWQRRRAEAMLLRDRLRPASSLATEELAARLAVLAVTATSDP